MVLASGNDTCGSENIAALLRNEKLPCSSDLLDSFWLPKSSAALQGAKSMVNFENNNIGGGGTTSAPYLQSLDNREDNAYEDFDRCFKPPGKKRRLTASQVQFLEKNFEVENKLEPDRKVQLAKEIGLQPLQVAVWFQNRRARSKNQQLEKNYDSLKAVYDKLKDDYDSLLEEKQVLQKEFLLLQEKLLVREKGKRNSKAKFDAIKLLLEADPEKPITNTDDACCKQEVANSAKSGADGFDSSIDSPHYTEGGNHSSLIDSSAADDSSSQDDNLSKGLFPPPPPPCCFLKLEDCCYDDDPPTSSCNFGFSLEDQPFWSWPY